MALHITRRIATDVTGSGHSRWCALTAAAASRPTRVLHAWRSTHCFRACRTAVGTVLLCSGATSRGPGSTSARRAQGAASGPAAPGRARRTRSPPAAGGGSGLAGGPPAAPRAPVCGATCRGRWWSPCPRPGGMRWSRCCRWVRLRRPAAPGACSAAPGGSDSNGPKGCTRTRHTDVVTHAARTAFTGDEPTQHLRHAHWHSTRVRCRPRSDALWRTCAA